MWAETFDNENKSKALVISIHSARVGGDEMEAERELLQDISIHSARVGGDSKRNHFFVS